MVAGRRHSANTVEPSRETTSNCSGKKTFSISGIVETLEEDERACIEWGGRGQAVTHCLNRYVTVADDASTLQLLWRSIVCEFGIGEGTRDDVGHLNCNIEIDVRVEVLARLWADNNG